MSLVASTEAGFSLFHLFGVVSGLFQPLIACYGLYWVVPLLRATTLQNLLTCKFTINQLHVDFITTECKCCYEVGQLKIGQIL